MHEAAALPFPRNQHELYDGRAGPNRSLFLRLTCGQREIIRLSKTQNKMKFIFYALVNRSAL